MRMILPCNCILVFDLDDTLYPEKDFETSGIRFVLEKLEVPNISLEKLLLNRANWIQIILDELDNNISKEELLALYRNHTPDISLYPDAEKFINKAFSITDLFLITDGRSLTQRSKLRSLGIEHLFKKIIISEEVNSEKPAVKNFLMVGNHDKSKNYVYIGDNIKKDFITPNQLGWLTICLRDRGNNIHKQNFDFPKSFLPQITISSFDEIIFINNRFA